MAEYIEREAAIQAISRIGKREYDLGNTSKAAMIMIAEDTLRTIPTADVAPVRHGWWRFDDFDGDGLDYQCSWCRGYQRRASDYCPNCGAKMDEVV